MCNFLSAVVMRNGDILCNPQFTDSHEDLLRANNVRDGLAQLDRFARVEFTPPEDPSTLLDLDTWAFKVDEKATPAWLDKGKVRASLAARVKRMFVLDERKLLLGGCWILGKEAYVAKVKNARIYAMLGSSKVGAMYDSSKVGIMCDSSTIGDMYDSSKIVVMRNSSQVGYMYGSSKVDYMQGSSKVVGMFNFSKVGDMYDSSVIPEGKSPVNDYRHQ